MGVLGCASVEQVGELLRLQLNVIICVGQWFAIGVAGVAWPHAVERLPGLVLGMIDYLISVGNGFKAAVDILQQLLPVALVGTGKEAFQLFDQPLLRERFVLSGNPLGMAYSIAESRPELLLNRCKGNEVMVGGLVDVVAGGTAVDQ